MQSKYFNPQGKESLADVVHAFGDPVPVNTLYQHMGRHQERDVIQAEKAYAEAGLTRRGRIPAAEAMKAREELKNTVEVIEQEVQGKSTHERTLDEFIREGRAILGKKEMNISAANLLAAIKIRSEIDKSTKDRRLDMIKAFFAGGEKKEDTPSDG